MRLNQRTLSAAVFATTLFLSISGCGKKAPVAPPPPAPAPADTTPPPPAALAPRINSFTAEPRNIERGQSATLRWSVANATDIAIDQSMGAVQANGNRQVFPSNTTPYTLTARSSGGTAPRPVTVEGTAPPPPPPPPPPPATGPAPGEILTREAQDIYF